MTDCNCKDHNGDPDNLRCPCCPSEVIEAKNIQPMNTKDRIQRLGGRGSEYQTEQYINVKCPTSSGCSRGYLGLNPRTTSPFTGQRMILDKPNLTGEINPADLYTSKFDNYGRYSDYTNMKAGDIEYYIDDSLAGTYFKPNFVTKAHVEHAIVKDPMGIQRPDYRRTSCAQYSWDPCYPDQCFSSTHDTLEYRQSIMASQMRKFNESRYMSRLMKVDVQVDKPKEPKIQQKLVLGPYGLSVINEE